MADDLGYGEVGCFGSTRIKTPNIDALAAGGMRFTDYHSNGAVCSPTRAALLTGRYQQRCGIDYVVTAKGPARETGMPPAEITFAEVLKAKGYVTGIFGKWHLGYNVEFNPAKQGFDEFRGYVSGNVDYHSHFDQAGIQDWWKKLEQVPEEGYVTDLITKHGIDFIERHKDEAFCLYLPHEAPHYPYQGRNDPVERLGGGKIGKKTGGKDIPRAYKEMVEVMDEGIGRVVETVRRLGLERRTFIFFCSDNGACKKGTNGPLNGFKGSLWEGGHRVPAAAYWPGRIKAGSVSDETVLGMDVFPTMASITGAKLPAGLDLDGVDLSGLLFEGKSLPERTLFWRYRKEKAVRKGPWKLLVQGNNTRLFNLGADLGEKNDLALTKPAIVKGLEEELAEWERGLD
ncbi:MAG: sulfatase-like hydrolase/transferase [Phycisphaerae bacterium]|nr:sulfatase-like hydrolase/transferase [Phycisphaerae bacterium]